MNNIDFTSSMFKPVAGEEEETNPGIIGKALAEWLAIKLKENGYPVGKVIAEDWGWLVEVRQKPFYLWVGCGNVEGEQNQWRCFVQAEPNIFQRFLLRVNTKPEAEAFHQNLIKILKAEKEISDVREEEL